MMRNLLLIILLLLSASSRAQIRFDSRVYNYGDIAVFMNDTAYFRISNTGSAPFHLLPTQPSGEYAVFCSDKTVAPGNTITIGIVYYTDKKGRFEVQVPLYFSLSREPYTLTVKGNIKSIDGTALARCPSVENSEPLRPSQKPLSVVVKDAVTGELLGRARVEASSGSRKTGCVTGVASMAFRCNIPYGQLRITASHPGYESAETLFRYNEKEYTCFVYLHTVKEMRKDSIPPQTEPLKTYKETVSADSTLPVYIPVAYADSGFASYRYRPNHLIFIIDISGSMKDSSKLYYLKRSIRELTAVIRPSDHVTLITYTNKVRVVFENRSGLDRYAIESAIDTLSAGGGSNGSQSLVIAYELAEKYFIEGGNNQIFISTDGLLNSSKMSNEDLYRLAAAGYRKKGVKLSAIGFGNDPGAIAFLHRLAKSGRGNFLRIGNLEGDLQNLLREVMAQCRI